MAMFEFVSKFNAEDGDKTERVLHHSTWRFYLFHWAAASMCAVGYQAPHSDLSFTFIQRKCSCSDAGTSCRPNNHGRGRHHDAKVFIPAIVFLFGTNKFVIINLRYISKIITLWRTRLWSRTASTTSNCIEAGWRWGWRRWVSLSCTEHLYL